ncbi:MAG: hypothetical protein WCA81_08415 [Rhizomicrobium sp.]
MALPDPATNEELATLQVDFPRLFPDTPEGCPRKMDDIQEYLILEDADTDAVEHRDLKFIRTAMVENTKYWIWEYRESDGAQCYVTVSQNAERSMLAMDGNWDGLTPEQYILGDYRHMF